MRQAGFTVIEIVVATILVGLLALAMAPALPEVAAALGTNQEARQRVVNQRIANGLLNLARENQSPFGIGVPLLVYNSVGYGDPFFYTIVNTGNTDPNWVPVARYVVSEGVASSEIAGDGSIVNNARVFQLATPLTKTLNLYGTGGPQVTVTYQFGAIYTSNCPRLDTTCYQPAVIPGGGTALTTTNFATWKPPASAVGTVFFSTLPAQIDRVKRTAERIDLIRDAFRRYYRTQQLLVSSGDSTTNYFPNGTCTSPCTTAGVPTSNQGCYDGWYPIDSNSDLLPKVGISTAFGNNIKTAFNSTIDYCRDYHPMAGTYSKSQNAKPNVAALRIRKLLDDTSYTPDRTTGILSSANNIVITF